MKSSRRVSSDGDRSLHPEEGSSLSRTELAKRWHAQRKLRPAPAIFRSANCQQLPTGRIAHPACTPRPFLVDITGVSARRSSRFFFEGPTRFGRSLPSNLDVDSALTLPRSGQSLRAWPTGLPSAVRTEVSGPAGSSGGRRPSKTIRAW